MNLPRINERDFVLEEAARAFSKKIVLESQVYEKFNIKIDENIFIFSQMISNLNKKSEDNIILNEPHKELETIFDEISNAFNLTLGEKVNILLRRIESDANMLIKIERNTNKGE